MKVNSKYQKTNANKVYWWVQKSPLMVRACHSFRFPLKQTPKQEFKYPWFIWEEIPGNTCGTVESKTRKVHIKPVTIKGNWHYSLVGNSETI